MKIVLIRGMHGKTSSVWLPNWAKWTISCCLLGLPLGAGIWIGSLLDGDRPGDFFDDVADALESDIDSQQEIISEVTRNTERQLQALSLKMAKMQVQLARMEALGEVLTVKAELEDGEFDFSSPPAIGGPELGASPALETEAKHEILSELDQLGSFIEDRGRQLNLIADLFLDRELSEQTSPSGLPVEKGWLSSFYGNRIDPFSGESAWHNGVDIAGKHGSGVLSAAGGVVTYAGNRYGYGEMIEISHDNGLVTRYGHNSELLVTLGEVVKKGQIISRMGTTGRSTGPHVHFEVYKNGRAVDPASYIRRTVR